MSGRITAAIVAAFVVLCLGATAIAQPEPDPSKQCKKGRTTGTGSGSSADQNQNGYVCVDPETGEVYDDKEQFAPDEEPSAFSVDENQDFIVCYKDPDNSVVTDNEMFDFENGDPTTYQPCPPGFTAGSVFTPPMR